MKNWLMVADRVAPSRAMGGGGGNVYIEIDR